MDIEGLLSLVHKGMVLFVSACRTTATQQVQLGGGEVHEVEESEHSGDKK